MNCEQFHTVLQSYLDGADPDPPFAWEHHARACPACDALQAAACSLAGVLKTGKVPVPPAGLAERVALRAVRDFRVRRRQRRLLFAGGTALAACLVLALGIGFLSRNPRPGRVGQPAGPLTRTRTEPASGGSLPEEVARAGSAVAELTTRTADESLGPTLAVVADLPRQAFAGMEFPKTPEPGGGALREAGIGVSAGLEPLTESARRAVDLFRRELPPLGFKDDKDGY